MRTLPCRSGAVSSRCFKRMMFFSYSCASFGWPVIGPAMRTIFFGFSAACSPKPADDSNARAHQSKTKIRKSVGDMMQCHLNRTSAAGRQALSDGLKPDPCISESLGLSEGAEQRDRDRFLSQR